MISSVKFSGSDVIEDVLPSFFRRFECYNRRNGYRQDSTHKLAWLYAGLSITDPVLSEEGTGRSSLLTRTRRVRCEATVGLVVGERWN